MIERYSDHAANERTFLAWVRTAIAIMAFGFLVQKFDLFLRIAASFLAARPLAAGSQIVGDTAGLLLIVLGGVMMALAAVCFRKTTLEIDAKGVRPGPGALLELHSWRCFFCQPLRKFAQSLCEDARELDQFRIYRLGASDDVGERRSRDLVLLVAD